LADALPSFPATNYKPNQKSHKLRAKPRDLQFRGPFLEMFFDRGIMGLRPTQGDEKAVEGDGLQAVHNHHYHRGFSH